MPPSRGATGTTTSTSSSGDYPPPVARTEPPNLTPRTTPPDASAMVPFLAPSGIQDESDRDVGTRPGAGMGMDLDTDMRGRGPDDYAIESLASSIMEDTTEATTETFYIGDQQGIGYILDIVGEPGGISQHYGLPYMVATHDLAPQDVAYLRAKGVFSVPSEPVCQALLTAYFYHVHPILPVVDAAGVLTSFRNGGASAVNLLLLWSMFSVAANYVDKTVVRQAGYESHKEMKKSMFTRAKCLYDNGCEEDRISIIQSVSLLAFWYSDLGERTESWHWMGIAISLSQTIGLNRDPDRGQYNTRLSDRQRQLWRRIWWSCFFRDRWLSLGMGRPMRINIRDCDTPMPSAEDLTDDVDELSPAIRDKYIPSDFSQLADHWVALLHLSKALGSILSENYCPTGPLPSRTWIETTELELMRCMATVGDRPPGASPALSFYSYHLRLHFNAATIALWRPYSNRVASGFPFEKEGTWFAAVNQKIRTAAANSNTMLDKIISDQLIGHIGPMTVPVLVPAMNSHLLESKSTDPLIRQSSLNKLDLFMMVLKKIQDVYSSATFIHGLFLQAIEKLNSPQYSAASTPQRFSLAENSAAAAAAGDSGMPMDTFWQIDDRISEFWDSMPVFGGTGTDVNGSPAQR
ncbi:Uu.00g143110.m01.CDS01 [Anthostomella pinea]|uniref:Uu.00g143110.m01.CDS01 n=1 Tax=Anthostomella pinea TaxID=933095 RepID=A0AAI8VQN1_9PEZI|nr:Uu.00g143110.m01.CDS01 [Anthostomella pinea]